MKRSISSGFSHFWLMASVAVAGCSTGGGSAPTTAPSALDESATRAKLLAQAHQIPAKLDAFDEHASHLPGSTAYIDRITMETVLQDLSTMLPLLAGDNADAIFHRQLTIIDQSRQDLADLPPADSAEKTIAAAMQATYEALDDISTNSFSSQTNLRVPIAALRQKMEDSDALEGGAARQAVADETHMIGSILRLMYQDLETTLETTPAPSVEPSTKPSAPTAAPSAGQNPLGARQGQTAFPDVDQSPESKFNAENYIARLKSKV
jgi:hypothetical protein